MYLNGVALLSSVGFRQLGRGRSSRSSGCRPIVCSGWFHNLLAPDLQKLTIEQIAQKARDFAHGPYAAALEKGDRISAAETKASIVKELNRFTGLSPKYIEETNLRISPQRWFKELLRDKRETVGRLDARFTGYDVDAAGERDEYDSSEASYEGAYVATFQDYVRRDLKWNSDMYYTVTARRAAVGSGAAGWSRRSAPFGDDRADAHEAAGDVRLLRSRDAVQWDRADGESTWAWNRPIRKNVSSRITKGGHMMYIDKKAQRQTAQGCRRVDQLQL